MKLNYLFAGLVAGTALLGSCDPVCDDAPSKYEFELPMTISPAKDTFRVGDTILVESKFSDMVRNRADNQRYHLTSYKFLPFTSLRKIDDTVGLSDFSHVEVLLAPCCGYTENTVSSGATYLEGEYVYLNGMYELSFKMILVNEGTYMLGNSSGIKLDEFARSQRFPGKCDKKEVGAVVVVNNGSDNNIYLLENSPNPDILRVLERPQSDFYDLGRYAFVVVE